jgi:L-seryl-tRNA(Ser) seleniumtransferase
MAGLEDLPSVHEMLESERGTTLTREHGRALVLLVVQRALQAERDTRQAAESASRWAAIESQIAEVRRQRLRPVINATGVILHTNLGRAPLAPQAAAAAAASALRYTNLELDLETGRRGMRHDLVSTALCHLTGAEAAAVVNNGAAATLLMLAALTRGKEVIVSRGELVEIGGGFRMPDIMRLSGARMVEVGTTNRTRLGDYADAITEKTGAILKVHASNFQVVGFTEAAELEPLARLAHERGLLLLQDLGSGALLETTAFGAGDEPRIQDSLRAGVDLLVCSGDKLLGGPQAGLLLGRAPHVSRALKHPLARAVRVDKMTLAALAATLDLYLTQPVPALPVWEMIRAEPERLRARAEGWADTLKAAGLAVDVGVGTSAAGGGSLPGRGLPTTLLRITPVKGSAVRALERLRHQDPPVIARIEDGRVVLDPRTVLPDEDDALLRAVRAALS